ncbi:hypothetical protein MAFF211271_27720 [Ralstonia syzygii subsp. indonesiensis]|nr:hypothetical protein MAFF211271_27720 [Ralstonia pseudosolanacearum]
MHPDFVPGLRQRLADGLSKCTAAPGYERTHRFSTPIRSYTSDVIGNARRRSIRIRAVPLQRAGC